MNASVDYGTAETAKPSSMEVATKRGPTESTNPAAETANRTTVESTTPKPTATKAASAKTTAVSPAKTAVSTTTVSTTAPVSTTAATGRCNCWGKSDRCTDCGGYGKSDDCFSNHHGKSPRWNDIPRQRQP